MELDRYLRRIRLSRWQMGGAIVLVIGLLALADHRGWFLYLGAEWNCYQGKFFPVVRVASAASIDIEAPCADSSHTRVWLLGIDAPLIRSKFESTLLSEETIKTTRQLCQGQKVCLLLERHRIRDRSGRLVAYVQLADGSMLNERLLEAGLVQADDQIGHRHSARFVQLQRQARHNGLGLWAPQTDPTPEDSIR